MGRRAWFIAGIYALVATLWIYYSDGALTAVVDDPQLLLRFGMHKGLAFVAVTSVLLLLLMRWAFGALEAGYISLRKSEAGLAEAQKLAQLGSWDLDLRSMTGQWSEEMFRLFYRDPLAGPPNFARFLEMIHPEDRGRMQKSMDRAQAVPGSYKVEYRTNPDLGPQRSLAHTIRVQRNELGQATQATGTTLDVTVLKENETEIIRLSRLYAALSQVNQAIVWTTDREELFRKICRALVNHGEFCMAWIGWRNAATEQLEPVAEWGDENGYLRSIKVFADDRPEGQGPSGIAFRQGKPVICEDLLNDPMTLLWREEILRRGFRASAVFPIRMKGEVQGTLSVYSADGNFFQQREIALLEEAAGDISFALDNMLREEERVKAEALAMNERRFSDTMIESLPGILYFYNEQGKFLRWNRNFERVSGYTSEELARMNPLQFFESRDQRPMDDRIKEVFERGESFIEAPFLTKSGETIPYFFTGKRVMFEGMPCLVGVGIDVSGRREAEEAKQASEARYLTLFEYAPVGILIGDEKSVYLDANPAMCQMLGYSRQELIGMHAKDILAPEECALIDPAIGKIRAREDHRKEWHFVRKDGSRFPAEVMATQMPDGNLLGLVRDITELKQAEAALRELNESLEHKVADRTEELQAALVRAEESDRLKSAFLATMSHELRTPLNSIIGFTGIVLQGLAGPLNPEQGKQLGMVRGSARHLLELINDVLDLSKIEADQLELNCELFDLKAAIEQVAALVRPLAEKKGLDLTVELDGELSQMEGDRRRVGQILINLLNNAIKFTEKGEVKLVAERVAEHFSADGSGTGPALRIAVKDSGLGIRAEDLPHLFQPFRQIDSGLTRQHEGTGLGLAICRRLAGLMGGEITVASKWSQGSEFALRLPLRGENRS